MRAAKDRDTLKRYAARCWDQLGGLPADMTGPELLTDRYRRGSLSSGEFVDMAATDKNAYKALLRVLREDRAAGRFVPLDILYWAADVATERHTPPTTGEERNAARNNFSRTITLLVMWRFRVSTRQAGDVVNELIGEYRERGLTTARPIEGEERREQIYTGLSALVSKPVVTEFAEAVFLPESPL